MFFKVKKAKKYEFNALRGEKWQKTLAGSFAK